MARHKRMSKVVVVKAEARLNGIKSIDLAFEVTEDLTLVEYAAQIALDKAKLTQLNIILGSVDNLSNEMGDLVATTRSYNTLFWGAVGTHYRQNISEYEKAGGTRILDYKRSPKHQIH